MNNSITMVKFGDLYDTPSRNGVSKPSKIRGEGYKFINMGELFSNDRIDNIKTERVPLNEKEIETSLLLDEDLLFARQSLVLSGAGKCSIFISDREQVTFESHLIRVRLNKDKALPLYYYYLFKSPFGRGLVYSITEQGAGQSGIRGSDLSLLKVPCPPISEQKAIAKILGDLDDKIELNRKMNETLEQMAQALFRSWFVDFDPVIDNALAEGNVLPEELQVRAEKRKSAPDHLKLINTNPDLAKLFPASFTFSDELNKWIPEGWEVEKLGHKVGIKRGGSPRPIKDYIVKDGYPWLKIADATSENSPFIFSTRESIKKEGLKKTVYLKSGELILSNSATPGLPKFLNIDSCIHDGWLYFPKKSHFTDHYLYFLFLKLRETFVLKGNGSVFTNLKTDILKEQAVIVPHIDIMNSFTNSAIQFLNKLKENRIQIQTLAELRDTLLPKLISGQMRVDSSKLDS